MLYIITLVHSPTTARPTIPSKWFSFKKKPGIPTYGSPTLLRKVSARRRPAAALRLIAQLPSLKYSFHPRPPSNRSPSVSALSHSSVLTEVQFLLLESRIHILNTTYIQTGSTEVWLEGYVRFTPGYVWTWNRCAARIWLPSSPPRHYGTFLVVGRSKPVPSSAQCLRKLLCLSVCLHNPAQSV